MHTQTQFGYEGRASIVISGYFNDDYSCVHWGYELLDRYNKEGNECHHQRKSY